MKFCDTNQIRKGRMALSRSIGLDPYRIKSYLYFLLTLFGLKVFTMAKKNKAKVLARSGV